jgi:hypothetical protein
VGARLMAVRAVGPGSGQGDGRDNGGIRRSKDGYDSGYSSLMSSLHSLSEIAQNTEVEEEKRARNEDTRLVAAAAASGGGRPMMTEVDPSLEEARELEGLTSLRGSDDLLAARLREQQQRQQGLQRSLDDRLSRLETLASAAAQSGPSVRSSSARSSSTSVGSNAHVSLSGVSVKGDSASDAPKPTFTLADNASHWLQASAQASGTRQSRDSASAATVDSDSSRGHTPTAGGGGANMLRDAPHGDSSFSSQYWNDEFSGAEGGDVGERRAIDVESAVKAGQGEADVEPVRMEAGGPEALKKEVQGGTLELTAERLAGLPVGSRLDSESGRQVVVGHESKASASARDEELEEPGARRARGGVAWEVLAYSATCMPTLV